MTDAAKIARGLVACSAAAVGLQPATEIMATVVLLGAGGCHRTSEKPLTKRQRRRKNKKEPT